MERKIIEIISKWEEKQTWFGLDFNGENKKSFTSGCENCFDWKFFIVLCFVMHETFQMKIDPLISWVTRSWQFHGVVWNPGVLWDSIKRV